MEQKQVKIIGLKVNEKFGILQSCNIKFDKDNRLIVVKGEVGSGKTTLQKSLQLGTQGSDTLKYDKNLYGKIDQEVFLTDGETPIVVGCKSSEDGKLAYTIYTRDLEGKKVKDPVVDGVKLTPSKYLQSLQTALTWRMEELTSENPTVQKKILLDLYKDDLAKVGVIYDKSSPNYVGSILDKIEKAEALRSEKDFLRKQVGGFAKHLTERGYNVYEPETLPKRQDVKALESTKNKLQYDLDNTSKDFDAAKSSTLSGIRNESEKIILSLKDFNIKNQGTNNTSKEDFAAKSRRFTEGHEKINECCSKVNGLANSGIISEELRSAIVADLNKQNDLVEPKETAYLPLVEFDENGVCLTESFDDDLVSEYLTNIKELRIRYVEENRKTYSGDTTEKELEIQKLDLDIKQSESINKICDAVDSFNEWSYSNSEVLKLKTEYARKLKEINTGVEGVVIEMEEVGERMNVHLMYNGHYSPEYFSNPKKEYRKLSSYSGTQKPMICLLVQNYLLNKKPKALRYLWIDNVPIDHKTKDLLNSMGEKLNLTIFINITGDFEKDNLESGEILLEGGEVFFNKLDKDD